MIYYMRASGARVNVAKSLGMLLGVVDSVETWWERKYLFHPYTMVDC